MSHRAPETTGSLPPRPRGLPLYARVLIAAALGTALGVAFGTRPYLGSLGNKDLGLLATLVIRLLKALAAPLILFAILDAFARTRISPRHGWRLLAICLVNVSVAFAIGLTIMNTLRPGDQWRGHVDELLGRVRPAEAKTPPPEATLDPLRNLDGYVPKSLVDPFADNRVITIVLLGLMGGAALRRVKERQADEGRDSVRTVERFVEAAYQMLVQMLDWVVQLVPCAVFGAVAQVVGQSGIQVFRLLWVFLATLLLGLAIHALVYYPLVAWLVGRKPPRIYLGRGLDAILTGLSINSSLATVPVTLRCLARMNVSERSSRLAACVGTNLNNDGITLYEAMAALFLAQAVGSDLGIQQQAVVVLASIMAGAGVAGVPEAGLIVLPLVLGSAGLPDSVIAAALPLIIPVDWIIARARSGVNVMSDMLVAILLDALQRPEETAEPEDQPAAACHG